MLDSSEIKSGRAQQMKSLQERPTFNDQERLICSACPSKVSIGASLRNYHFKRIEHPLSLIGRLQGALALCIRRLPDYPQSIQGKNTGNADDNYYLQALQEKDGSQ